MMGQSREQILGTPESVATEADGHRTQLPVTIGKHRVIADLGRGGMGDVFLAVNQGIGGFSKLLVVKQLRPALAMDREFLEMFLEEARIVSRLTHPNIVHTYEAGQDEAGIYYIAMEYLEGQPLYRIQSRALKRSQAIPLTLQLWMLREVLSAVHHAHELRDFDGSPLGLVHRDLSPQNVMVTYSGEVKVLDFGIAKAISSSVQTRAGIYKGKLTCMAPEQLQGADTTARVDVFAAGAMLWRAVTNQSMWEGYAPPDIARRLVGGRVPRIRDVLPTAPEKVLSVVEKATAANPKARYATALEMRRDIDELLDGASEDAMREAVTQLMSQLFGEERDSMRHTIDGALKRIATETERTGVGTLPIIQAGYVSSATGVGYTNQGTPSAPQPVRNNWPLALVGAGLLVLGAGAFALAMAGFRSSAAAPQHASSAAGLPAGTPPQATPAQAAPNSVPVGVSATPAEARLYLDGVSVLNPYSARVALDGTRRRIRAEADGFEAQERDVVFRGGDQIAIHLVELPRESSPTGPAASPGIRRARARVAPQSTTTPPAISAEARRTVSGGPNTPAPAPKVQVIDEPQVQVIE